MNHYIKLINWIMMTNRTMEDFTDFDENFKLNCEVIYGPNANDDVLLINNSFKIKEFVDRSNYEFYTSFD